MIYEYTCTDCKHNWEFEQKITADAEKICPKCGKETAKRLISGAPPFHLKGAGWAKDGYKG